jgi:hypothetical protein
MSATPCSIRITCPVYVAHAFPQQTKRKRRLYPFPCLNGCSAQGIQSLVDPLVPRRAQFVEKIR